MRAVDGISFRVEPGELVGYVGPNGAGKSTTVKMLTGILVPSKGRISVAGLEPSRRRIQLARRIGVVFGQRVQLWWDLPLRDSFELLRHIYRVPIDRWRANLDRFCEVLELEPFLGTPVRQLSLGQRMRGELTAAMLHDPEILFLDEPTIGLDVVAKARVREFLAEINRERGVTVLLTTHDLADIERLCSRLLIIDHGRLIYDGTIERLIQRYGEERTLVVDLEEPGPPLELEGARVVRVDGPRQWLRFRRDEVTAAQLTAAVGVTRPSARPLGRRARHRGRRAPDLHRRLVGRRGLDVESAEAARMSLGLRMRQDGAAQVAEVAVLGGHRGELGGAAGRRRCARVQQAEEGADADHAHNGGRSGADLDPAERHQAAARQRDRDRGLLERSRPQPLGDADEVVGEHAAARAALEVRVEEHTLEVGQLAVQAKRRVLACAVTSSAGRPHHRAHVHVKSDGRSRQ